MVWYLDTSAFLKLITLEDESPAMRKWFRSHAPIWSSQLLYTEALRAGARLGIDIDVVHAALDTVSMVLPSAATFFAAGRLMPVALRSLDALHLATAIEIGDDLEGLVTYDQQLTEAALMVPIQVIAVS
ncbi:MAG: type II toxin-antitoxin system VapC family toxin [Acidimicrobiales bacterium]